MFEVSSIGSSKLDAAVALRQTSVRPQYSVKNQMMKLLRRSKSAAHPPTEKIVQRHSQQYNNNNSSSNNNRRYDDFHLSHHHHHHNHNHNNIHNISMQNGTSNGKVVNIVDGLPCVVVGKNRKVNIVKWGQHILFFITFYVHSTKEVSLYNVAHIFIFYYKRY